MKRIKLVVAYDGTNYCGWQLQNNAETVEGVLNRELSDLLKETIVVTGASRTDSGVHAQGNIAVFDSSHRMDPTKIYLALNQKLPEDIRILHSDEVSNDYHPRKQNSVKTYEYKILNARVQQPSLRFYTHFCHWELDIEAMKQACVYLIGEHDFKSFCTVKTQVEDTVRTIYELTVEKQEDVITIRVKGNGFLYNMVRIIAGTLIQVGMGNIMPVSLEMILDGKDRTLAGPTAPAKGLTLKELIYEEQLKDRYLRENKYWKYEVLQNGISMNGSGCILLWRCEEEELAGVLGRTCKHLFRNGASKIYLVCSQYLADFIEGNLNYQPYTIEETFPYKKEISEMEEMKPHFFVEKILTES